MLLRTSQDTERTHILVLQIVVNLYVCQYFTGEKTYVIPETEISMEAIWASSVFSWFTSNPND